MLQSRGRRATCFARQGFICASCLVDLVRQGPFAAGISSRTRRFATAAGSASRPPKRKGDSLQSKPSKPLGKVGKGSSVDSRVRRTALTPTRLRHALNSLRSSHGPPKGLPEPDGKPFVPKPVKVAQAPPAAKPPSPPTSSKPARTPAPPKPVPSAPEPPTPTKKKRRKKLADEDVIRIKTIESRDLNFAPVPEPLPPVPTLSYGLDRVLFNPGVYQLQDPRSHVFNFDPYLAAIMPIQEFDFNALKQYVTSSKDSELTRIAATHSKKYAGSTSSMTSMLSHFHFLLSAWRPINPVQMSRPFVIESTNFTRISRAPAAVFLLYKDGTYAIDADKEFDSANVLSMLGKSMEKLLTLSKEDFEKYRRTNSSQLTDEERNAREAYHYTTIGDFALRSQLDAYDPRLPGTGMFDLKTRAVVSIRMDSRNFQHGTGYEIRHRFGQWESYEREYFDMIRSAFLKYSLQVRMGRMDGIFVAFHNTQRIFGFQYIPLPEMDTAIHGTGRPFVGDREFKLSLHLLNAVLDKATAKWPKQSLRLHFETRPSDPAFMYIFAKPVTPEEIDAVQSKNKAEVEEFERQMMGIEREAEEQGENVEDGERGDEAGADEDFEDTEGEEETSLEVWEDMMEKVEETLQNDELGINSIRDAIEDALEESGLLQTEESRRYLEALLEALTSNKKSSTGEESDDPTAGGSDEAADSSSLSSPRHEPSDETQTQVEERSESELRGQTDEMEDAEVSGGPERLSATEIDEEEPSLKDLIIRLAAKYQAKPAQPRDTDDSADAEGDLHKDAVKLRRFEQIVSELVRTSRDVEHSKKDESKPEDHATGSASTAPQTPDGSDVSESSPLKEPKVPGPPKDGKTKGEAADSNLLGMVLTIRNKVDDKYVKRPMRLNSQSSWEVEYSIKELPAQQAERIYEQLLQRRRRDLERDKESQSTGTPRFQQILRSYSRKGRIYRQIEDKKAKNRPVYIYGVPEPLRWEDVFGDDGGTTVAKPPQK
ncbi:hypothetical protein VTK73DRAFT_2952 [Phialemonium thermophilum]|uniref:Uncharacterized protein n=1 Tax=Phialemonium thermophilum TaxID=223376 RepID=A0ABR3X1Y3_9PEZI